MKIKVYYVDIRNQFFSTYNQFSSIKAEGVDEEGQKLYANPAIQTDLPKQKIKPIPKARSLFLFAHDNKFRIACHYISNHRWFTNSLLICILVSSILLAVEDPVNYKSKTNEVQFFKFFLKENKENSD